MPHTGRIRAFFLPETARESYPWRAFSPASGGAATCVDLAVKHMAVRDERMTTDVQLRAQICAAMEAHNINKAIAAVRLVANLPAEEALDFIAALLDTSGNLGMKLEALSVLPGILASAVTEEPWLILEKALKQQDPELVRKALMAVQEIPSTRLSKSLLSPIFALLKCDDTDIKYQAVLALMHFGAGVPHDRLVSACQPLTNHPNKILREAALLVLQSSIERATGYRRCRRRRDLA